MKLTPLDKLHSRRNREFEARVLKAVEKPHRHPFIAIINAPFFLWLLSALFLTLGGTYLTAYQQCLSESDRLSDAYQRIAEEVLHRREQLAEAIFKAKDIADVRAALTTPAPLYSELRTRTLYELTEDMVKIRTRVDYSDVKGGYEGLEWYPAEGEGDPQRYWPLFLGREVDLYSNNDLQGLREFAMTFVFRVEPEANLGTRYTVIPRCSLSNVLGQSLFGRKLKVIAVEPLGK